MSATLTDKFHLIAHKRNVLLIAAIGAFGYLASVAASPLASLFLIEAAPPKPSYESHLHVDMSGMNHMAYSTDSSLFVLGEHTYVRSPRSYEWETPPTKQKRRRRKTRTASEQRNLYNEISEQRRLLSQLESEVEGKHLLDLVAESDLLLMLNQRVSNHLNFINKRLNPPPENKSETSSYKNFALGNKIAANAILDAPNTIDLTQTGNVQLSIDWTFPDQQSSPKTLPVVEPKLESPDFKIVAAKPDGPTSPITNSGARQQTWLWLISPEKTGDREIALSFSVSNGQAVPVLIGKETKDYRVRIPIKVLTELGLTSTQTAWAKAIGAIIGIIGTIAGYSFWRYRTRKNKPPEDTSADANDTDDSEEDLDAEIILRALARHLRKGESLTHSDEKDESRVAEETGHDPPKT